LYTTTKAPFLQWPRKAGRGKNWLLPQQNMALLKGWGQKVQKNNIFSLSWGINLTDTNNKCPTGAHGLVVWSPTTQPTLYNPSHYFIKYHSQSLKRLHM
jgi:hypothetical protein